MYCIIKFLSLPENTGLPSQSYSSTILSKVENKEILVNPNCYTQILLDYICAEANIPVTSDFDLCNEFGELVDIKSLQPHNCALEVLRPRGTYYIVLFMRDDIGNFCNGEPLLSRYCPMYSDLDSRIKKHFPLKQAAKEITKKHRKRVQSKDSSISSSGKRKIKSAQRMTTRSNL